MEKILILLLNSTNKAKLLLSLFLFALLVKVGFFFVILHRPLFFGLSLVPRFVVDFATTLLVGVVKVFSVVPCFLCSCASGGGEIGRSLVCSLEREMRDDGFVCCCHGVGKRIVEQKQKSFGNGEQRRIENQKEWVKIDDL
jgi:hypothetical protein